MFLCREGSRSSIQFTLASPHYRVAWCNLLNTEVDTSIRRHRARFCKCVRLANAEQAHDQIPKELGLVSRRGRIVRQSDEVRND
jgi:hypothetical protein